MSDIIFSTEAFLELYGTKLPHGAEYDKGYHSGYKAGERKTLSTQPNNTTPPTKTLNRKDSDERVIK